VFETNIVLVGNVLTAPEWRRTASTGALVATFRVASTARRMDRESGRWVDGDSLRLRVSCWRKLAEGVSASIAVGDPVVVMGRIFTRDWTDSDGNARVSYEMEASAVGHDLGRGKAKFFRTRPTATDAATGPEADSVVRGEAAELVPGDEVPVGYGEGIPDVEDPTFDPVPLRLNREPVATGPIEGQPAEDQPAEDQPVGGEPAAPGDLEIEVEALVEEQERREQDSREQEGTEQAGGEPDGRRRSRRAPKREPIPA
jgi:single-strand DNA-binding protein